MIPYERDGTETMNKSESLLRMEQLRKKALRGAELETWGYAGILLLPVGLGLLFAGIRMREKANQEMDELYREVFIREPLTGNFENVSFEPYEGFSEEMVEGFQLCPMGNEFDSEAYGKCSCKDVHIELSDVTIQDYARLAKKNNTTVFFKGRMVVLEFPEKIGTGETIFSKSFSHRALSPEEEQGKLLIENEEYNRDFDLYVSDPQDRSQRILPRLLEELGSLSERHRGTAAKLDGNKLILALDDGEGAAFYRKKKKEVSLDGELAKVQKDMDDIKAMIALVSRQEQSS